ncbi:MAG: type VI secretion system-associated protein TagF [Cellvibrionaceae bacterium]
MNESIGIFGKLPAHGDFIERNLPRSFTTPWDDWLQRCLASSREQIGSNWLDHYLTSPIWRFVLSPGTVDSNTWAGILLPSVDSVGRYFPLAFVSTIAGHSDPFLLQLQNSEWFSAAESIAISGLQEGLNADETLLRLSNISAQLNVEILSSIETTPNGFVANHNSNTIEANYATLLNSWQKSLSNNSGESHSLWWNSPSGNRPSSLLSCRGLPNAQQYASMINGQWS